MSKQGVGKYFCFIKNKVSSDWKDLAWCLGFETPDIDNIDGKHRDDKSRCMDLLQQWYKQKGNAATIHVLIKALQDAELQHVVDSLKDQYPGLDRTTSVDNLLALPPPSRHVDRSSLRGLDLAVIGQEDQPFTDGTDNITTQYRQVQSAVRTTREKSKQAVKAELETMQGQVLVDRQGVDALMKQVKMLKEEKEKAEKILLEKNEKIQELQEANKSMEARIEALLTSKQPMESGSQQKDPLQPKSGKQSMDKFKATNTGQVKQSVVQSQGKDTGADVRFIRAGRPWVRKVSFGEKGSDSGKFNFPWGVAVSQDNEIYIADCDNCRIQVFTMDGVYIRQFTTTPPGESSEKFNPHDVAVDRNGNLWVVTSNHVVQYSREGTCLAKPDIPGFSPYEGIASSMLTEQVIVTGYDNQGNSKLWVLNLDGSEVGVYGSGHRSPKPWRPSYVTVDGEGNILVTDDNNHCFHVLDREGNFKFKLGSEGSAENQFKWPHGICVDGRGNIIVADRGNQCVKMFDSQGTFLCYIVTGMNPQGVTVSPGGDVVVTEDNTHTVSVWTQH